VQTTSERAGRPANGISSSAGDDRRTGSLLSMRISQDKLAPVGASPTGSRELRKEFLFQHASILQTDRGVIIYSRARRAVRAPELGSPHCIELTITPRRLSHATASATASESNPSGDRRSPGS
jgi:hypothetical protein